MIEVEKNKQGFVIAHIEWLPVNRNGKFDNNGKYVWVDNLEIHPDYQRNGIIRKFMNRIAEKAPQAEYAYWDRDKYNWRIKLFRRNQLIKGETNE